MMAMKHIPVFKESLPYHADFRIAGTTYTFTFNYNSEGDFFTIDLERNGDVLVQGEKIVYGRALFLSVLDERFPDYPIVPIDFSMQVDRVGWRELGNDVYLVVLED